MMNDDDNNTIITLIVGTKTGEDNKKGWINGCAPLSPAVSLSLSRNKYMYA